MAESVHRATKSGTRSRRSSGRRDAPRCGEKKLRDVCCGRRHEEHVRGVWARAGFCVHTEWTGVQTFNVQIAQRVVGMVKPKPGSRGENVEGTRARMEAMGRQRSPVLHRPMHVSGGNDE